LITTYYWLRAIALAFAPLIPVWAAKVASLLFLDSAATPPRRGGESSARRDDIILRGRN
jgi:hypothetical protein